MQTQIAAHLNCQETEIKSILEMAWVYCVVVKGRRATFVSKKVTQKQQVTQQWIAGTIAEAIEESENPFKFRASIWDKKAGEKRVYISYWSGNKKKDCGYVRITDSGVYRHLSLQAGTIEAIYAGAIANLELTPELKLISNDSLSKAIVEECWECGATYSTWGNVEAGNMCCRRCA